MKTFQFLSTFVLAVAFFVLLTTPAYAFPEGVLGYHGAEGNTCTRCHSGGTAPDVALGGETEVLSGSTVLYTLIITSNAPTVQQMAGFNLVIESPSGGAYATGLTPIDSTVKTEFSELTHSAPQSNDTDGVARFGFEWVVPAETGAYTIYYAGNSTDGNGATSGDMSTRQTQTLTVVDDTVEPPDPTDNQPPTVSFTQPVETEFTAGSDIPIVADAADDSAIASVQLFINGDPKRVDSAAPFRWNNALTQVQAGIYVVELVATDDVGVTSSTVLTITVPADNITPTPAPTITPTATVEPTTPPSTIAPTIVPSITPTPAAPLTVDVQEAETAVQSDGLILIFLCIIGTVSIVTMKRRA